MTWLGNAFDFLSKGGPVMVPLIAFSIIAVAVLIERFIVLRRASGDPKPFMARLENSLALGKFDHAVKLCEREETPLADMLAAGLRCADPSKAERTMQEQALESTPLLHKRLSFLDTVITVAPLLGLLGTVTGLIRSFSVMSREIGHGTTMGVTGGIAEALISSATGLAIAIFTLVGYNYLKEMVNSIINDMELYGTRLMNILTPGEEEEDQSEAEAVGA